MVLRRIEHLALPVMVGVLPLVSYKNAEFLHNEVPGMQIPAEVRERMRKSPGGEAARKERGIDHLPGSLWEAIEHAEGSELLRQCLGDHLFESLLTNKKIEWSNFRRQVTDYELKRYLPIL